MLNPLWVQEDADNAHVEWENSQITRDIYLDDMTDDQIKELPVNLSLVSNEL